MAMTRRHVFDFHARLVPGPAAAARLIAVMDSCGISRAVVSAGGVLPLEQLSRQIIDGSHVTADPDNDAVLAACAGSAGRLVPFYFANPHRPAAAYREAAPAFRGLEVSPAVHGVSLKDPRTAALLDVASVAGHPIYTVCLARPGCGVADLADLAGQRPGQLFVLGHSGVGEVDVHALDVIASLPNVMLETSGGYTVVTRRAIDKLGAHRVLFGTEYPLQHPSVELAKFRALELPSATWRAVGYENACRLLSEPGPVRGSRPGARRAPRIALVGAGIGGLALATGLADAGIECEVYEQADEPREVGAGVQLAPNAVRHLLRWGLADLDQVGVRADELRIRRWDDGVALARTPLGRECEEMYGAPYYTVHRADLQRVLRRGVPAGTVHLGRRCDRVTDEGGRARLHFADGTTRTADVVVGCDGIRSAVRSLLRTDQPRYSGQTMYRGVVRTDRLDEPAGAPFVQLWIGPGQHCVFYPVRGGELVSFAATLADPGWRQESWCADGEAGHLVQAYAGWHREVTGVLAAADRVMRWALHDRDPLDTWSTERVTLLGDAAHPMLPFQAQGANQAVEDAAALVECLRDVTTDNVPKALARYQQARIARTADIQLRSRTSAATFHLADPGLYDQRDRLLAAQHSLPNRGWLFGHDAASVAVGSVS